MAFRPNMTCFTRGIQPCEPLRWRCCEGMVADLWHADCLEGGGGHYLSPDPRVVVFLDDTGGAFDVGTGLSPSQQTPAKVLFVPAGVPLWSRVERSCRLRHLDLHFDSRRLQAHLGATRGADLSVPLLIEDHPRVQRLAHIVADETATATRHDAMIEGLVQALLIDLFSVADGPVQAARGGLTPRQMRQLEAFMAQRLHLRVSVAELAEVAGLSESWFAHAFRRTTGTTPHRWQTDLRLARVREMLETPGETLAHVAAATGFADQAHLSRTFRAAVGSTPSAWRNALP